ncbi:glycosyltransferase family 25 protein [Paraferrimonas haliotis]|uniref:Glycosyl transferase n=1 Tax=Paraferrimonas haliotis TaxID=2013866 RepID=A0AA37WYI2_9GAMM|nr:glycosyltransferase family 25 protein [Paraferrimonas haliotis]GLS83121.1 glycosyl transferase [Paraferrimonas haliotis]
MNWRVFVINLDSSTERLDKVSQECQRLGIEFERVSATRGSDLSDDEMAQYYDAEVNRRHYFKQLNAGEIGCYLSHYFCWKKIVDEGLDYALILEDDSKLTDELGLLLSKVPKLSRDWDYLKLSTGSNIPAVQQGIDLGDGIHLHQGLKLSSTTTGQFVSAEGAKKLIDTALPIRRPVDKDLQYWFEKDLRCFVVKPIPVLMGGFDSDIDNSSVRAKVKHSLWHKLSLNIDYNLKLWQHRKRLPALPSYQAKR